MPPKTNEEIAEGVAMRLDGRTVTSHEHFREMVKEEVLQALASHTTYWKERVRKVYAEIAEEFDTNENEDYRAWQYANDKLQALDNLK